MSLAVVPPDLARKYRWDERHHGLAVLSGDFPDEWADLCDCLRSFTLKKSAIVARGKGRSRIPIELDGFLATRGWGERSFDIDIKVDGRERDVPTHKVDNIKTRVGVEVEWNNKTEFFDRDLNNFRLLHGHGALSVGVIVARQSELQSLFNDLGVGRKYGNSTTHWDKLIPKVDGGGAAGCPLVLIGLGRECYDPAA